MSNGDHNELVEAPEGWRVAIKAFDDAGFTYGDAVKKSWLFNAFGIEEPKPQTSLKQAQEANLQFLASFQSLKSYFLNERSMALKTCHGVGHEIVKPPEQTEWADTELEREMKKAFARAAERLVNIDHSQLTTQQSRQNAESLARTGTMRALMMGQHKLTDQTIKQLMNKDDTNEAD